MKKIFLTGAEGFVGQHLLPRLLKAGHFVTAHAKSTKSKSFLKNASQISIGNLAKEGEWGDKLKDHRILIHLAAEISSKNKNDFIKNNVKATENIIKVCKKYKFEKIILFSSAAVTSMRQDSYSETKKRQEEIVTESGIPYLIIIITYNLFAKLMFIRLFCHGQNSRIFTTWHMI